MLVMCWLYAVHFRSPVANPFKSKEFHRGTVAKLVGAVVFHLYDVAAFVSAEKDRLGFGKVHYKEVGVNTSPPALSQGEGVKHGFLCGM